MAISIMDRYGGKSLSSSLGPTLCGADSGESWLLGVLGNRWCYFIHPQKIFFFFNFFSFFLVCTLPLWGNIMLLDFFGRGWDTKTDSKHVVCLNLFNSSQYIKQNCLVILNEALWVSFDSLSWWTSSWNINKLGYLRKILLFCISFHFQWGREVHVQYFAHKTFSQQGWQLTPAFKCHISNWMLLLLKNLIGFHGMDMKRNAWRDLLL